MELLEKRGGEYENSMDVLRSPPLDRERVCAALAGRAVGSDPEIALRGVGELRILPNHAVLLGRGQLRRAAVGPVLAVPQVALELERLRVGFRPDVDAARHPRVG